MERICWAIEKLHKGDAQKCYDECQSLPEITPENVLEKARDKKTELHKCFEWNDSIASEKYRLIQARQIIQHFVIVQEEKEEAPKIRSYQITTKCNTYEPTRMFLQKPDEYAALLERAKNELEAFKRRYQMLAELEQLFEAINELLVA
jgi:protease II